MALHITDFDVRNYGAKGDTRYVTDAVLTNTSTTVTSATAAFTAADVGKVVYAIEDTVPGTVRLPVGTIVTVNSATSITASIAATLDDTGAWLVLGTDDTTAIQAAAAAAFAAVGKTLYFPAGGYMITAPIGDFRTEVQPEKSAPSIVGEGSGVTQFFLHPSFAFTNGFCFQQIDTGSIRQFLQGISINGTKFTFNASGVSTVLLAAHNTRADDLRVDWCRGFTNCIAATGAQSTLIKPRVEGGSYVGCIISNSQTSVYDPYFGNCSYLSLHIAGCNFVNIFGGTLDESITATVYLENSDDVAFSGALIYGHGADGAFALDVDGNSTARLINCSLLEYGGTNGSGMKVQAGGVVHITQCRFNKAGTGKEINNAGTIYDNGGNSYVWANCTGTRPLVKIETPRASELTIATGAITVTGSYHDVDTEADAASDDLDTINGGADGRRLVLRANNAARSVVVKDGTGNIQCAGDMSLDNTQDTIELIYDGTLTAWLELSRSDNGA
jgi:hypothetical protein